MQSNHLLLLWGKSKKIKKYFHLESCWQFVWRKSTSLSLKLPPKPSLPRQAVKKAVLFWDVFPRGQLHGGIIVPLLPSLPHRPDWCVLPLFSTRIIGIIEWHVVLRAKLQPNGLIVWAILPSAVSSPGARPEKMGSFRDFMTSSVGLLWDEAWDN